MNLDFTEDQEMLRTSARDFLQKECPKTLVRELEESDLGYSPEMWQKMAGLGWLGLTFPEEYGGVGLSFMDLSVLLEEMGRNILPGPLFSTVVLGGQAILMAGTEQQKQEFLPKIANGEMIVSLAFLEPCYRYDPTCISAQASAEGDDYVLSGTKLFVPDANVADCLVIAARTQNGGAPEEGITLFLVDAKSEGITCNVLPTIGMDKQCEITLSSVKVPKANMLGDLNQGWNILDQLLTNAMVAKCLEMSGGAQAVLEMTTNYAKERVAYGKTIASFQTIQHYLANMWLDAETVKNIAYQAAASVSEGLSDAKKEALAAKAWANEAYKRISERGVQIHGGIGITRDHDMGLYYRRAKAADVAFGDTDYCQEMMAREIGM